MASISATPQRRVAPVSSRRRINRRILRFSLTMGAVASTLVTIVDLALVYPRLERAKELNLKTISAVRCVAQQCDPTALATDWKLDGAEYLLDLRTRYFLNVADPTVGNPNRFEPLDYSDTSFIAKFRQPTSYSAPDMERWRLYSRQVITSGKTYEILVGYAEKASWKMIETPPSLLDEVDSKLILEANKMADSLPVEQAPGQWARTDGFQIVDTSTGRVVEWGPWLPIFFPSEKSFPVPGRKLYRDGEDLYVVQADSDGRLLAVSFVSVGSLSWLALVLGFTFLSGTFLSRVSSQRLLWSYFALRAVKLPTIEEACKTGEGQNVEFKRGISNDPERTGGAETELLRSIAAFANTEAGGVIFIGIDDAGHIRGLDLDFKERDRLEQKIHQLVQNRIDPSPPVDIAFQEVRGLWVAKITVARGDALAYTMGGVIYVRRGSSDIQCGEEDLRRLLREYTV